MDMLRNLLMVAMAMMDTLHNLLRLAMAIDGHGSQSISARVD